MWLPNRLNLSRNYPIDKFIRLTRCAILTIFLVSFSAIAQAPLDVRIALVIGNSAYVNAPPLVNPKNDARSMTIILRKLGFEVINVEDATRDQILDAIKKMQASMKGRQAVAMLYYAGHGLQSNWHNYMVPVDINPVKTVNIPQQTVDIEIILDAFKNSATRMNIVVLDACRDNPFGEKAGGKGLAQIDAPQNTYIAFATSPGNVAKDGDEKLGNGLFTSYMIKELQRPAPIEDMFKRVRLQVRKASDGSQIPWDSSSLELDFAFNDGKKYTLDSNELSRELSALKMPVAIPVALPTVNLSKVDDFEIQKAEWDKIKDSKNANDFYEYLNRYPNGSISEEATFKLNQLAKVTIAAVPDKYGIIQSPNEVRFRVGDEFKRITKDINTGKVLSQGITTVVRIENGLVYVRSNSGQEAIFTQAGGTVKSNSPEATYTFDPPLPSMPADGFQVGKKWTSEAYEDSSKYGRKTRWDKFFIDRVEEVTVPAGTYKAFVVEREAFIGKRGGISTSQKSTSWWVPGMGLPVKSTRHNVQNTLFNGSEMHEVTELISYKKGG